MVEKLLTIDEVAQMLQVSRSAIYKNMSAGTIPYLRINKRIVRFRPSDIQAWLDGKLQGMQEVSNE